MQKEDPEVLEGEVISTPANTSHRHEKKFHAAGFDLSAPAKINPACFIGCFFLLLFLAVLKVVFVPLVIAVAIWWAYEKYKSR